jgi:hypothetical protein
MIREDSGTHFDPEVVGAFLRLVERGEVDNLDERVRASLSPDAAPEYELPSVPVGTGPLSLNALRGGAGGSEGSGEDSAATDAE